MANIESELICNICLELLNEPHHYPCGHNFCLRCITDLRSRQIYNCPECRTPCPDETDIVRDFRLRNVIEAYRRSGHAAPKSARQPSAYVWPDRPDLGVLLVISLLLLISVYTSMRLQITEQALKDSQILPDSIQSVDFLPAELQTEKHFEDQPDLFKSQSQHIDETAASSGPLVLLLAPLRWLWLLVWTVFMCVWWLISSLIWLVFQCVWLVYECVRLVFVSIWELFSFCICFVCSFLMQSFSIFVYVCGLASITMFSLRCLMPRSEI